ncbi:MAG: helix-turn-helix domain-containing protein [Chroococcales cyanobacterium]
MQLPELSPLFKEIGVTSEELQVAAEELLAQTQELEKLRFQAEAERNSYWHIFQSFPYPYLVTNGEGIILDANSAAAGLLNIPLSFLIDKPLSLFIIQEERQRFRYKLHQMLSATVVPEYKIHLHPRHGRPVEMLAKITPVYESINNVTSLQWLLRNGTQKIHSLNQFSDSACNVENHKKHYIYHRGEIILLEPEIIWVVNSGVVKLTTINEKGEEVIVGLVAPSMSFGADLTALPVYQATALSPDVELVRFKMNKISASEELMQSFLSQVTQRLKQAERLLAIAGKRKLKDRLWSFLVWLKQEFGETVEQGTRLMIRLTHQDIADACCTSRVTVTRELGKLQDLGKIIVDEKNHIIFI